MHIFDAAYVLGRDTQAITAPQVYLQVHRTGANRSPTAFLADAHNHRRLAKSLAGVLV